MTIRSQQSVSYLIGILASLALFSFILAALGFDPIASFGSILYGSFGSIFSISETFVRFSPLLLTSLAFLIGFKARFFNIGAEGQLYMGALGAYMVSSQMGGFPSGISIPLIALAAFLSGAAWLAIPLIMRVKLGINEIFPTVVLNFVAIFIISWLTTGPLKDPNSFNPQTSIIPTSTWLPIIIPGTRLNLGVVLSLVMAIVIFVLLFKTVLGYEIRATGLSPQSARHGGINVTRTIATVGLLSGGLAGLAGMIEVSGAHHLLIQGLSPGFGHSPGDHPYVRGGEDLRRRCAQRSACRRAFA